MTTIEPAIPTFHPDDDLINALLDGELDEADQQAVHEHLETCARCQESLESLQAVKSMLANLPEPVLPRSFTLSPAMAAQKPGAEGSTSGVVRLLPLARMLSIAAVIAFLVVGAALAWGPVTTSPETADGAEAGIVFSATGTRSATNASQEAEAPVRAAVPGQVVDRGVAATSSTNALSAMGDRSATTADPDSGMSTLQVVWLTSGAVAIVAGAFWAGLHVRSAIRAQDAS